MLSTDTKRRIDACRDILVGKLPLPTDQVELITLTLIYKFMDDLDEESVKMGGKRSFFVGDLAPYRWRALLPQTISAEARLTLFAEGIEILGGTRKPGGKDFAAHLPGLFRDIFRNAFVKFRDGRILTMFLTDINEFEYSHSEELGNAFEYLLQCMGTQGENGQFRTPRHIIDFIIACLNPQPHERILDPACGTCGFLVSAYRHILAQHTSADSALPGDLLTHDQRQKLYRNLTGYDITDLMVKLSKVNLFLHGFPDPAIHIYDTLSNDARWDEKADVIAANPPFMTPKGGVTPHAKFRVAAKKAEVLFTDYIAEHLTPTGRAGIIVPNGIVATTQNAYIKLRRFLVEDSLVAVVSLPAGVFKPYSGVKTSILFLDKPLARKTDKVLFLKITADGFDLGDQRRPVAANDLPEAQRVVMAWLRGAPSADSALACSTVEKRLLLEHRACSLQAEVFLGAESAAGTVETVRLGDVATFEYGYTATAIDSGDARYIRITDIDEHGRLRVDGAKFVALDEEARACLVHKRDVLVARIGATAGKTLFVDSSAPAVFASYLIRVNLDDEKVLPEFFACWAQSGQYWEQRDRLVSGGGQPQFNANALKQVEIPHPPLAEQRRIVAEIEGYQKVIDGARQVVAAYRAFFEPDYDWPRVELRSIVSLSSGGTPPKGNAIYWMGTIPWVSAKDMKAPRLSDAQLHISESAIAETATALAPEGSVLILVRGMGLANGVPVCEVSVRCAFNQDIKALTPVEGVCSPYLAAALRREETQFRNVISTAAHGTLRIETDRLLDIQISLPPLDVQRRIIAELDAESAEIEAVRRLITRFEAKVQRALDRACGCAAGGTEIKP